MTHTKTFLPIILGTDINAYTMSVSFYEEYGIKPVLVGRTPMAFTEDSTIIQKIYYEQNIEDEEHYVHYLHDIALHYKADYNDLILIGTNDFYVSFIIDNQEALKEDFVFNYIKPDLLSQLYLKKNFYETCEQYGIDTPLTFFHSCETDIPFDAEIPFPVIVKPSNGVEYYHHPFEGMEKVYKVYTYEELHALITKIHNSGYRDDLIIQDFIPGDDTYMWDSVYYANQHGKAQYITFAQVILQEHTKTGVGNYTALIVRYHQEMMEKLASFMEAVGYQGFANFDIKYDERDGKFKLFEVNIRQGRSSYYLTACGHNLARCLVEDLIEGKEKELTLVKCTKLFSVVPKGVLRKYILNKEIVNEVNTLIKEDNYINPLFYSKDTSIKRRLFMTLRQINYFKKYKNADWKQ